MNMLFSYYNLVFCAIYANSAKGWLYSGIQSQLIDWLGIGLIIPAGKVAIRIICREFTNLAYVFVLYF
jgi:hypothetical protein